jgi:putative pyruvate formate lyase activating enzyme
MFCRCHFCEWKCKVDRETTKGKCGVQTPRIATEFLHYGEESVLIPSHTIFFSGCTFFCVFCQNWDISHHKTGTFINPKRLADIIEKTNGKNVNWVGGDPTPNIPYILEVLTHCNKNIPQIWNSNMYCTEEALNLLNGVIDLYLSDFKYGNNTCASRLSNVDKYWEIITRNHVIALQQGELIIRHLVMPNHTECCSKVIMEWIAQTTPQAHVNLMAQYRPEYNACTYPDIDRGLNNEEYSKVYEYGKELNLSLI